MKGMFQKCIEFQYLDLTSFKTFNVTDMSFMFNKCNKLKEIKGIDTLTTSKVNNMLAMFQLCKQLISLNLTSFDTFQVTDMFCMFNECWKLKEIKGIEKFKTSKVKNMCGIFKGCYELPYLNLNSFDTSQVTDMGWMFSKCRSLKEIKGINQFKTSNVSNMRLMFNECNELEYLDLTKFDTSHVTDMGCMFNECYDLKEIKGINNFNTLFYLIYLSELKIIFIKIMKGCENRRFFKC